MKLFRDQVRCRKCKTVHFGWLHWGWHLSDTPQADLCPRCREEERRLDLEWRGRFG